MKTTIWKHAQSALSNGMTGEPTRFQSVLARADDETLQALVGRPVLRLLQALDPNLTSPRHIRRLVTSLSTPAEILRNTESRTALISLLSVSDATDLAELVGANTDQPHLSIAKLKLRKGSAIESTFLGWFGVTPPSSPKQTSIATTAISPKYGLFDHQRTAARRALALMSDGRRRVVVHMPTGSGKTRTALDTIAETLNRNEPALVLWLAYSEELCEQAASEFEACWASRGDRPLDVFRMWGGHPQPRLESIRDGFVVASLGTMFELAKKDGGYVSTLGDRAEMVVIDEAHQSVAPTYSFVLDFLTERSTPPTALLGLTATPGRTWNDPDMDRRLADFFGGKKVILEVPGYSNPVEYLIDRGYLARPEFRNIDYKSDQPLDSQELLNIAAALDIPAETLKRLAEDEKRNLLLITEIEALVREGHRRILVFATTVDHSYVLAAVLQARGIDAAAVTGKTELPERSRIIARFRSETDRPNVLCNFGVLTTGFDAPRTSAAVIARPTKSLVLYSQMVGRATRGTRAGGNEHAKIVTVVDTHLPGFGDMADAFTNWEDVWDD